MTDGTSTAVDIELANSSLIIGQTTGIGVLVNRARVDYRMSGFSPPPADYPVNLYLSPPADGNPTTGLLTAFPLASTSLKQWLIDSGVGGSVVELTARVTFYGLTDEGGKVETAASIGIALTNTGGGGSTPAAKPTVFVFKTADASKALDPGEFTVNRSGSVASGLTVNFSTTGSSAIAGVDYTSIGSSVSISAGESFKIIYVNPLPAATTGKTIKININTSTSYISGTPSSATLTIID